MLGPGSMSHVAVQSWAPSRMAAPSHAGTEGGGASPRGHLRGRRRDALHGGVLAVTAVVLATAGGRVVLEVAGPWGAMKVV